MQILETEQLSPSFENFVSATHSEYTKKTYVKALRNYLEFHNIETHDSLLQIDKQTTNQMIMRFVMYKRNVTKNSLSRINVCFSAIRLFYNMNDYDLNWSRLAKYKGKERQRVVEDRTYTKEEIQTMLQYADMRMKVIILTMLSSGVRTGGLAGLKLKDLTYIEEYKLYRIIVYSFSPGDSYYTFCTPECAHAIKIYLDARQKNQFGETLTPDSPLIRQKFDSTTKIEMTSEDIQERMKCLLARTGILKQSNHKGRNAVMRCHGLRKFFDTICIDSDMKHVPKEMLMGHRLNLGMDRHYYRPTSDKLLIEYLKVVDELTINDENRLKLENTQLKQKQKAQELRLSSLEEKFEELTSKFI